MMEQSGTNGGFWRSLDEYNIKLEGGDRAEFLKRAETEFMSSPYKTEDGKDGIARRDFLKLMGASVALATTSCIRRPVQKIIPYAQAPKELTPGIPNFYTSTWFDGAEGYGILVKTLDGRPVKMEGNPLHPMNKGGLSARGHAEVLALYDPDRLHGPVRNLLNKGRTNKETIGAKWDDVDSAVTEQLAKGGVVILSSTLPSPSARALIGDFSKVYGGARWVQYDTLPNDAVLEAQRQSYGKAVLPRYRIDRASFVVTIDADILGTYLSPAEFSRQWADQRRPGAGMLRMVSFESAMTLTGMNADDRIRIKPSQQLDVVLALIGQVSHTGNVQLPASASGVIKDAKTAAEQLGMKPELLQKIGEQLWQNRGKGLVIAGGLPTADAVDVQVAVNILNSILGNDGQTIDHDSAPLMTSQGSTADLAQLINDMNGGKVKTLIIHNLNPAYALPVGSGFVEALRKVDLVISTSNSNDETGRMSHYVLPAGSSLESWGDAEFQTGAFSIQQPTIRPLWDSRSFEESLLAWTKKGKGAPARVTSAEDWHDYVRGVWKSEVFSKSSDGHGKSFDDFWMLALQNGVVYGSGNREAAGKARGLNGKVQLKSAGKKVEGYELALYPTVQFGDGRFANVSWLQELPDPVTKVVWDNYASISLATARKEGIQEGNKVDLQVGDQVLRVPVHIQPGMHDGVIALSVGYGRTDAGKVGSGIGVNAYTLASFASGGMVFSGLPVTMKKTSERYDLATTQHHHEMEGRQIVVEATNAAYMKNPSAGIEREQVFSIWPKHQYTKHRWALSVDLNTCTGCSACVIACQSENNVPVVGKRYVMEGREMHWIRIDRYYKGSAEEPEAVFMPLMCQQCETAPCETVCPVLATTHSDEGLNDMVYNRCVGTRYCSNNCPYKVRRFNWFNYSKREAPLHMALNPDVTVRTRGVMEKCTFCVQRIRAVTTGVGKPGKPTSIKDGEIKTACQQTCPTGAIKFGDLSDPESEVSKLFQEKRAYALLEELNTVPRVRYMSRIRNADRQGEGKEGEKA